MTGWRGTTVDFEYPQEAEKHREKVRAWLADHPSPSARELAEAGYVAPHWPRPYGLDASPVEQLVIDEEFRAARVDRPQNGIAIGWAGPTIIYAGDQAQMDRYLLPLLSAEEIWCQLFSEPGAGSDLAGLSTRAERDGDEFIVNGQKIWTSGGHLSKYGILLARTNPDVPKHEGITYFICPMDTPGIEVRPIIEMTGQHLFNEVFFDDVRIPAENVVGEVNKGWHLAKVTLGNERVSLSREGALWGMGPTARDLINQVIAAGGTQDPVERQRLVRLYIESELLRLIRLRTISAAVAGKLPGPEASIRKALSDEHGKAVMGLAKDFAGSAGMLTDENDFNTFWHHGFLFSTALTVGGGTSEVQRNIIGERVLGLPKDIDAEMGKTWAEARVAIG